MSGQGESDKQRGNGATEGFKKPKGRPAGEGQKRKQKLDAKIPIEQQQNVTTKRSSRIAAKTGGKNAPSRDQQSAIEDKQEDVERTGRGVYGELAADEGGQPGQDDVATAASSISGLATPTYSAEVYQDPCGVNLDMPRADVDPEEAATGQAEPATSCNLDQMQDVIIIQEEPQDKSGTLQSPTQVTLVKDDGGEETAVVIDPAMLEHDHQQGGIGQQNHNMQTDIVATSYNVATAEVNQHQDVQGLQLNVEGQDNGDSDADESEMEPEKQYTQMKSCGMEAQQQAGQAGFSQTASHQNQSFVDYGQQSMYQHGNMGQVWYPHEPGLSASSLQDASIPTLHYPQPHVQSSSTGYRQAQYGMEPSANQPAYAYQSSQINGGYGSSQSAYLPQYVLGANGQYYRAVQGNDGLRYEMLENPNVMMSGTSAGVMPNYRASQSGVPAGMRVVSPGTAANFAQSGGFNPVRGGGDSDKEWQEDDDSDEDISKLKDRKSKKERIKRPMNAFLVWSCQKRAVLAKNNPGMNNADISVRLGEKWKAMTPAQKQPFYDEAAKIKADHKVKHPEWTYQPKPKKRRLGQGTTWLYAITENTRGGRVSHYLNTYNHYDGSLLMSSLNNTGQAAAAGLGGAGQMAPQGVMTVPMQHVQAAPPAAHAMYVNPTIAHGSLRLPAHMTQRNGGMVGKAHYDMPGGGAVYMPNQGQVLMGAGGVPVSQSQQAHMMGAQGGGHQTSDSVNSMLNQSNVSSVYQQQDLTNQPRAQNLSMNRGSSLTSNFTAQSPVANLLPDSASSESCEKFADMTDDARRIIDMTTNRGVTDEQNIKNRSEGGKCGDDSKQSPLTAFDEPPLPSLREFLHSGIVRSSPPAVDSDEPDAADDAAAPVHPPPATSPNGAELGGVEV